MVSNNKRKVEVYGDMKAEYSTKMIEIVEAIPADQSLYENTDEISDKVDAACGPIKWQVIVTKKEGSDWCGPGDACLYLRLDSGDERIWILHTKTKREEAEEKN